MLQTNYSNFKEWDCTHYISLEASSFVIACPDFKKKYKINHVFYLQMHVTNVHTLCFKEEKKNTRNYLGIRSLIFFLLLKCVLKDKCQS